MAYKFYRVEDCMPLSDTNIVLDNIHMYKTIKCDRVLDTILMSSYSFRKTNLDTIKCIYSCRQFFISYV